MKKFTLILVLVILISLTVVMPVFAGGGDNLCGWPDSFPGKMYGMMIRNYHADGRGYFLGNYYGHVQACHAIPPKTPWWAGN